MAQPKLGAKAPKSAQSLILGIAKQAQVESGGLTTIQFNLADLETKPARSGNVGFRITTSEGAKYTFWKSQLEADDSLIELIDEKGNCQMTGNFSDEGALITNGGNFWD